MRTLQKVLYLSGLPAFLAVALLTSNVLSANVDRVLTLLGGQYRLEQPVALSISPIGERMAIADLSADRIYVLDIQDRLVWSAGENVRLGGPGAVCFVDEENILYAPVSSPLILKVTEQEPDIIDTVANLAGTLDSHSKIGAIVRDGSSGYLVLDVGLGAVYRFTADWSEQTEVIEHGSGRGKVLVPTGLALAAGSKIVVSDQKNYPVQLFAPDGRFIVACGQNLPGSQQGWEASAVAVDVRETIWAADVTSRTLRLFDPAGQQIQTVDFAPSLLRPAAMAGTVDNRIVVLDETGVVVFYRID